MTLIQLTPDVIYNPNTGGIIRRQAGGIDLDSYPPVIPGERPLPRYVSDPNGTAWQGFVGQCHNVPPVSTDPDFSPFSLAEVITAEIVAAMIRKVSDGTVTDLSIYEDTYEEWRKVTESALAGHPVSDEAIAFLSWMDEE